MKKLHEIVVATKKGTTRIKDGRIMSEKDIFKIADNIERFHPEYPDVITHPHYGECEETQSINKALTLN